MNEKEVVLKKVKEAVKLLEKCKKFSKLMPEVRVNIVYALPDAKTSMDVVAVDGRITVVKGYPKACGDVIFGASDHMARLIIEVRKYDESIRAGINFKYTLEIKEKIEQFCKEENLSLGYIDRRKEPEEVIEKDQQSMPWKIKYLFDNYRKIPTIFYESEGWGKEPLFVIVGKDPKEVVNSAIKISQKLFLDEKH